MRRVEIAVVAAVAALLTAILTPILLRVRSEARKTACGENQRRIVIAQNHFPLTRPASRGDSWAVGGLDAQGRQIRDADGNIRSDNSKAFITLVRTGWVQTLATFACPDDPFVARMSDKWHIPTVDDFPADGIPTDSVWTIYDNAVATEAGRTYYSYSMQSRGPDPNASMSPKMDPYTPMVSDRNPYSVAQALRLEEDPNADTDTGNAWAHERRGQNVAFMDARVEFLADARTTRMLLHPANGCPFGYDYLYGDDAISPTEPTGPVKGSCPPRGQTAWMTGGQPAGYNVWMTD